MAATKRTSSSSSSSSSTDTEARFLYPRHVAVGLADGSLRLDDLADERFLRLWDATVGLSESPGPHGVLTIAACGSDGVSSVLDHLTWPFWDVREAGEGCDGDGGGGQVRADLRMLVDRSTVSLVEREAHRLAQRTGAEIAACRVDCPQSDERVVHIAGPPVSCTACVRKPPVASRSAK